MVDKSIGVLLWLRGFFKRLPEFLITLANGGISFLVFFMIIALLAFAGAKAISIYQGFANYAPGNVLHDTALLIVIVKAYKVLLYYYRKQRVSIKYIVEISIIAPAIEIIFASSEQPLWVLVLFGVFGVANLVIYIFFYEKLAKIDEKECTTNVDLDTNSVVRK